ncbi:ABC transporter ATP-binding protein [Wukongibacter sp. M2B1]|uniref:ABC transporter ATP-binding protein n=1 Tax=Wukongibacter sp. M2B1 TaxID=3088895 RepID=UPI003D7B617C
MLKIIHRLLKFSGKYRKNLIQAFIHSLIFTIFEIFAFMAIVYTLKYVVLSVENHAALTFFEIRNVFLIMLASVIGKIIFGSIANSKLSLACFSMCNDKRISIGNRLKRMPMGYFSNSRLGEIASIVTTTINDIEVQFTHLFTNIIVGLVYSFVITFMMVGFDWRVGLISVIALIIGLIINGFLQKQSKIVSPKRQAAQNELINAVLEYVQGIAVIKAFGMGEASNRTVDIAIEDSRAKNIDLESIFTKILAMYSYVFKLASCAMLMMACYLLSGGKLSVLNTLMIMVSSFVIYTKIENVGNAASFLQMIDENMAKIDAIENLPLMDERRDEIIPDNYNIKFENVSFSYDTRKILDGIQLDILENQTIAIVGPSGSGKTTICNLIARFWDVDEGSITIGGQNIKDYTYESLLSNISMVFQKVYLFQDTILNNIKFAKPDATLEEVYEAAKKACCHEFIMKLPNGYETVVGEGGGNLSGGEKQRISIARAILKDAPIIILDEATSSVDPINELQLQNGIEALTKHKTVIMIAHRLSTVEKADNIFVINQGNIVQRGKHEVLIREKGLYKDFIDIRKSVLSWRL